MISRSVFLSTELADEACGAAEFFTRRRFVVIALAYSKLGLLLFTVVGVAPVAGVCCDARSSGIGCSRGCCAEQDDSPPGVGTGRGGAGDRCRVVTRNSRLGKEVFESFGRGV